MAALALMKKYVWLNARGLYNSIAGIEVPFSLVVH